MKNFLKRWFGPPDIDGLNARIAALEDRQTQIESDKQLRRLIGAAVRDAIEGTNRDHWAYPEDMHAKVLLALRTAARDHLFSAEGKVRDAGIQVINETVNSEKFIDEIVARIQRKQL